MIQVHELTRKFGSQSVLQGVALDAAPGERIALTGGNGAGKTTLLRILATYLPATSGYATVAGHDVFAEAAAVRASLGYLPEGAPAYADMRVAEYLKFRGRLRRMGRLNLRRRLHEVIQLCDLSALRNVRIGSLSNGIRRRVCIAEAILHEPPVLLLDDPLAACDPDQAEKLAEHLVSPEVCANRTLLFTTHSRALIQAVATRILFLDQGRIVADVPGTDCLRHASLQAMFAEWRALAEEEAGGMA
ncbi:MAG: ABC transporter ATP-binding protein [Kiritimatiellia bacterium]|jgi:ABC-2 type transport system ATP-binding protein